MAWREGGVRLELKQGKAEDVVDHLLGNTKE
jgi:hypothetical protein